jgi:DNA repair protein RadD
MYKFPNESEIETAAELLVQRYDVSPHLLGHLFGNDQRDQANKILPRLGGKKLDKLGLAKLLIRKKGADLFSGSDEPVRELRLRLLEKLADEKIRKLFVDNPPKDTSRHAPSHMAKPLAEKPWHADGPWAHDFVTALEFPPIFAGVIERASAPTFKDIEPLPKTPELKPFQLELKQKMLQVLERDKDKTRCGNLTNWRW